MCPADLARRHATLLANLPGMAYRCANEPDWPMELVSEGAERLTGYPASAFIDGSVRYGELIVAADRDLVWQAVQTAVARREPFRITYRLLHADGRERHLWEQGQGVFAAGGRLLALEGFICDVSDAEVARADAERARTEAETLLQRLRESEERHRSILERASDGIILADRDLRLLEVNPRAAAMLGVPVEALIGTRYVDLVHPEDFLATPLRRNELLSRGSLLNERRLRRGDGSYGSFEISSRLLEDGHVLAILRDISERRAAEDERLGELRAALEAQRQHSITTLVQGVAHDFNNLLATISGTAELLRRDAACEGEARERVERLALAAQRATELTRQLMSVPGGAVDAEEPIDLGALLDEVPQLVDLPLGPNATLQIELAPDLPPLRGEIGGIRRLLMNLVQNAAEALEGGPGSVRVRVSAAAMSPPAGRAAIRIDVLDDGVGLDPTLGHDALCEPFVSTKGPGRGIGLAAVRGIVQRHGGQLELRTREHGGTCVTVWLPCGSSPGVVPTVAMPRTPPAAPLVLLVDDEVDVRDVLGSMCVAVGFRVEAFGSGEAALGWLEAGGGVPLPDVILLDVTMPGMDGVSTAEELLRRWPALRIVLMSGRAIPTPRVPAGARAPAFLLKPFSIERLRDVLAA